MLKVHNTLTGQKEPFVSQSSQNVSLYVCGITPYDYAHVGHGRVYVTFDVFYRLLTYLGYTVSYCRNFTDIDDKIIARARNELQNPFLFEQISKKYIQAFTHDMHKLNCKQPTFQPSVTTSMADIISFIQGLIDAQKAYQCGNDVYFSIKTFASYGKLSKRKLSDLIAGARIEINEKKRDPLDFALWKHAADTEPGWNSPWGYGRPGWHIECSAMAGRHLGTTIDIHGGGQDLIFPHHENEIAQSEGLHNTVFARYWLHNGFVRINQEKMSKSLGNFFTLEQVFKEFDPMVVRFYILNHHYRAPLDFSFTDLQSLQKSYQRLCKFFENAASACSVHELQQSPVVQKMSEMVCDDLNMAGMWAVVFESMPLLHSDPQQMAPVKTFIQEVIGLTLIPLPLKEIPHTPEIEMLIKEREKARQEKNWKKADELRDQLRALGIEVHDKKNR